MRRALPAFVRARGGLALANVDGDRTYICVQVLTNAGALDRDKQIALVAKLTELLVAVAVAVRDPPLAGRQGCC